jgi:hypothetical protein
MRGAKGQSVYLWNEAERGLVTPIVQVQIQLDKQVSLSTV